MPDPSQLAQIIQETVGDGARHQPKQPLPPVQTGGQQQAPPQGQQAPQAPPAGTLTYMVGDRQMSLTPEQVAEKLLLAEQAPAQLAAVQEALRRNAVGTGLVARLEQMNPQQRAVVQKVLERPDAFASLLAGGGDGDLGDLETALEEQIEPKPSGRPHTSREMLELRDTVAKIGEYLNQDAREKIASALERRIDAAISARSKDLPAVEAQELLRSSVRDRMRANPDAKFDDVVAEYAAKLTNTLEAARRGTTPQQAVGQPGPAFGQPATAEDLRPSKKFTREDLHNRNIKAELRKMFPILS